MTNSNEIRLIGNIINAPKATKVEDNKQVIKFRMAVNWRIGKNSDGSDKVESLYINVDKWTNGNSTVNLNNGDRVYVCGRLRQWEKTETESTYYVTADNVFNLEKRVKGTSKYTVEEDNSVPAVES